MRSELGVSIPTSIPRDRLLGARYRAPRPLDRSGGSFDAPRTQLGRASARVRARALTAFSKRLHAHMPAIALDVLEDNFARPRKRLANPYRLAPAMAAGISDQVWTLRDIAETAE